MRISLLAAGIAGLFLLGGCSSEPPPPPPPQAAAPMMNIEVLYATDRGRDKNLRPVSYGDTRSSKVEVGVCRVAVDANRKPGLFESLATRWLGLDQTLAPYKVVAINPDDDPEVFWQRTRAVLRGANARESMVLYVHGYNTSFDVAAQRAAQLSVDLDMPGHVAFFSWPSRGAFEDYTYDEATIDAREWALQDFMAKLAQAAGPGNLHVIAHSMGNRAFLRAMERTINQAALRSDVRFGQVILAAPDVDTMVFDHLAPLLTRQGRDGRRITAGATVYVARNDEPLWFSRTLHDAPRAGRPPPLPKTPGVTVVDIRTPRKGVLDLGHSDYATVAPVVLDIKSVIRLGQPSAARRPLPPPDTGFVLSTEQ